MQRFSIRLGLLVAALGALGLGCANPETPDEDGSEDNLGQLPAELKGQRPIKHREGNYFANVKARGSGCPAGTWDAAISDDGETFTLTFGAYEAQIGPGKALTSKDCQIELDLSSGDGVSYSVASFYYQGYVILDTAGMSAEQTAKYDFRGGRWDATERRWFTGPFDDSYLAVDEIDLPRRGWSACGKSETLRVNTKLALRNDRKKTGSGYINSSAVDSTMTMKWKLEHKRCR